jgi:hypothetical protein
VENGRSLKVLSSGSGAGKNEYTGANDGADPKGREADPAKRFLEASFRVFCVCYKLVDTLATEEL